MLPDEGGVGVSVGPVEPLASGSGSASESSRTAAWSSAWAWVTVRAGGHLRRRNADRVPRVVVVHHRGKRQDPSPRRHRLDHRVGVPDRPPGPEDLVQLPRAPRPQLCLGPLLRPQIRPVRPVQVDPHVHHAARHVQDRHVRPELLQARRVPVRQLDQTPLLPVRDRLTVQNPRHELPERRSLRQPPRVRADQVVCPARHHHLVRRRRHPQRRRPRVRKTFQRTSAFRADCWGPNENVRLSGVVLTLSRFSRSTVYVNPALPALCTSRSVRQSAPFAPGACALAGT